MTDFKRKRGKNFSVREAQILNDLVQEHKSIIENKKSDSFTWKEKERTWNMIANVFAATSGIPREAKSLRDKYEVLKRHSRLESAAESKEVLRNGGGSSESCVGSVSKQTMLGDSTDSHKTDCGKSSVNSESEQEDARHEEEMGRKIVKQEDNTSSSDWEAWSPKVLKVPKPKRVCHGVQSRRSLEDFKIDLVQSQKLFFDDENRRAEEKHTEENRRAEEKHMEENRRAEEKHKEEIRRAEEKHKEELTALKLKNKLLTLELLKNQREIDG